MPTYLEAFDGDSVAWNAFCRIVEAEGCKDFIETGTYRGGTSLTVARSFSDMAVWTIELDPDLFAQAATRFEGSSVHNLLGDSVSLLPQILPTLRPRPFFWLDAHISPCNVAHGSQYPERYPLRDELTLIATVKHLRPILGIHDFVSPGHPELSFDRDHGVPLDWNYIKAAVASIYDEPVPHVHNTEATGEIGIGRVGIVYIGVDRIGS